MPFGSWVWMGPRNHALDWGSDHSIDRSNCGGRGTVCHELCNKSSAVAEMGVSAEAKWAEKYGVLCPFRGEGELGPHVTQCRLGRGLPPYQVTS